MAEFKTGTAEWEGGFTPVSPIPKGTSGGDALAGALANILPSFLEGAGKGYARAEGAALLGEDVTAVQAEESVLGFQEATTDTSGLTNTEITDMKNKALKKFGTDDKRLQALVDAGAITTLEANARRHSLLQSNLSNPVLAMFQKDFLDASAAYTGGSGALSEQYFGAYQPTQTEQVAIKAQQAAVETAASKETAIQTLMSNQGWDRSKSEEYWYASNKRAMAFNTAKQNFEMLKMGSTEVFNGAVSLVNSYSNSVGGQIANMVQATGSLTPDQVTGMKGQLDLSYNKVRRELEKFGTKMTSEDYTRAIAQLDASQKRFKTMLTDQSELKAMQGAVELVNSKTAYLTGEATYRLTSNFPEVVSAFKIDPKFGELYINIMKGDMSAKFETATNPYYKNLYDGIRKLGAESVRDSAFKKTIEGGELTNEEDKAFYLSMTEPSAATGIKRAVGAGQDTFKEVFKDMFKKSDVSLSLFNDIDEWATVLSTPEGKAIVTSSMIGAAKRIRGMQFVEGGSIPEEIKVREVNYEGSRGLVKGARPKAQSYEFMTGGVALEGTVKKELVQMYKIIKKNPTILKEFGVESIDELLTKLFNTGL